MQPYEVYEALQKLYLKQLDMPLLVYLNLERELLSHLKRKK